LNVTCIDITLLMQKLFKHKHIMLESYFENYISISLLL